MLSNMDFRKKLGKGISIYPFKSLNVESANICVTASKYAWSIDTKKYLLTTINGKEQIIIPPKQTALIFTKEAICLGGKIAGTCHARVDLTLRGLGHIGTPMKPGRAGLLVMTYYNQTENEIYIDVDERIAVIMFHELSSKYIVPKQEDEHDHILNIFLSNCENPKNVVEDLNGIRKKYNSSDVITQHMINEQDYEMYKPTKNPFKRIKRNIPLNVFGLLLVIQLILMLIARDTQPYFSWLTITMTPTGAIFAALLSKKLK